MVFLEYDLRETVVDEAEHSFFTNLSYRNEYRKGVRSRKHVSGHVSSLFIGRMPAEYFRLVAAYSSQFCHDIAAVFAGANKLFTPSLVFVDYLGF